MRIKVTFPMIRNPEGEPTAARKNHKTVREDLLLDTTGSGVEDALVAAAERAAGPDQNVYVTRGYGPAGRLAVWIVDQQETTAERTSRRDRAQALRAALARVQL